MISIATSVAVMSVFVGLISPALLQIEEIFTDAGISSSYISLIFKAAAICFVTQITCDLCRDSGESAISTVAELWCRGAMTVMTVPIVKAILEMIEDFL
jgi:stage III sporulation protein AD